MQVKLGFAGTPEFAAAILEGLLEQSYTPSLVLTQPDRPSGRGRKLTASPVKQLALKESLPILQPATLKPSKPQGVENIHRLCEYPLDVLIVAAYGLILPKEVLDHPTFGAVNVHASLLPRWRGAAPVERAILAGDQESGATLMQMDEGLDTGDIISQAKCNIEAPATAEDITQEIARLGSQLLLDLLPQLGGVSATKQDEKLATYAHKLNSGEAEIEWQDSSAHIVDKVRAFAGRMTAYTYASKPGGERVKLKLLKACSDPTPHQDLPGTIQHGARNELRIACGSGSVQLLELQLAMGKGKVMDAAAALNGFAQLLAPGVRLG